MNVGAVIVVIVAIVVVMMILSLWQAFCPSPTLSSPLLLSFSPPLFFVHHIFQVEQREYSLLDEPHGMYLHGKIAVPRGGVGEEQHRATCYS